MPALSDSIFTKKEFKLVFLCTRKVRGNWLPRNRAELSINRMGDVQLKVHEMSATAVLVPHPLKKCLHYYHGRNVRSIPTMLPLFIYDLKSQESKFFRINLKL